MARIIPIMFGIALFVGLAYLTVRYAKVGPTADVITGVQEVQRNKASNVQPSTGPSFQELKQIELAQTDRAFFARLEPLKFGSELFWLIQVNELFAEYPAYERVREELLALLRAHSQEVLTSIDQAMRGFSSGEYPTEKLRLLTLISLLDGPHELVKTISLYVLETEIVPERHDMENAKNEGEASLAFKNAVNINVQLTAHALYLSVVDKFEGWLGTKATIEAQSDPWIKSRLAQQYLKKWPSQGESIRHELVSLLRNNTYRAPANFEEDSQE